MYDEKLTRQSLPSEQYRILLGTALCVFNSNNSFVVENILRTDNSYSWYELMDKESGALKPIIEKTISKIAGLDIATRFSKIVNMRNRIVHSFQVTSPSGEQVLATKLKNSGNQFLVSEKYLIDFIKENEILSSMLHDYRGF